MAFIDLLPADNEVERWVHAEPAILVDSDAAFYNQIDGAAPMYIDRGWRRSAYGTYTQERRFLQAVVHDMDTPSNAEALYTYLLPVSRISIQAEPPVVVEMGLATAYRAQAVAGQYFVETTVDDRADVALVSIEAFTLRVVERVASFLQP